MDLSVSNSIRPHPRRCTFCHDVVAPTELVACDACAVGLHPECWRELAGCPTPGCAGTATPVHGVHCAGCFRALREGEALACADCQFQPEDVGYPSEEERRRRGEAEKRDRAAYRKAFTERARRMARWRRRLGLDRIDATLGVHERAPVELFSGRCLQVGIGLCALLYLTLMIFALVALSARPQRRAPPRQAPRRGAPTRFEGVCYSRASFSMRPTWTLIGLRPNHQSERRRGVTCSG